MEITKITYTVESKHGTVRSHHRLRHAAERALARLQRSWCSICGNDRGGWGECSHNSYVSSAKHYNDRIVEHVTAKCACGWTGDYYSCSVMYDDQCRDIGRECPVCGG